MVTQIKYTVWTRYEFFGKNGIEFTRWFRSNTESYDTEVDAKDAMKRMKEQIKPVDKASKRKHEFEIRQVDITMLPQIKVKRPKGRPKKIENKVIEDLAKKLLKSKDGEIKVPADVGIYLYNDDNMQKIVSDIVSKKFPDKWVRYWHNDEKDIYMILKNNGEEIIW